MFSIKADGSGCARRYAQEHSRSTRSRRVRRSTAKQTIKINRDVLTPSYT
jgi:hypothetical protein